MAQVAAKVFPFCGSFFLFQNLVLLQYTIFLNGQIIPLAPSSTVTNGSQSSSVYVINNGQPKVGPCQATRPAAGYSSIAQFEGLWFRRFRSRLRPNEPPLQCSYNRFVYLGNGTLVNMVANQFTTTGEWLKQNETNQFLTETDQSTWINIDSRWHHHVIFFDPVVGVAVDYACINDTTTNGNSHLNIGSVYSRSPATNLTLPYLANVLDTFRLNGITDVLPLLPVDHSVCEWENLPKPTHLTASKGTDSVSVKTANTAMAGNGTSFIANNNNSNHSGEGGDSGSRTVFNNGQEKEGQCQATMPPPPANYSSIAQFEGLWFLRLQSRQRPREPLWKCSYARYLYQGNFTLSTMISKQSVANSMWTHLNETSTLNGNDTSMWTLSLSIPLSTTLISTTRVLYLDTDLGTALVYSCANTAAGHRSAAALLSRSPETALPADYTEKVLGPVLARNAIHDVLPLHPVNQTAAACQGEKSWPKSPENAPDGRKLELLTQGNNNKNVQDNSVNNGLLSAGCNCTCPRSDL